MSGSPTWWEVTAWAVGIIVPTSITIFLAYKAERITRRAEKQNAIDDKFEEGLKKLFDQIEHEDNHLLAMQRDKNYVGKTVHHVQTPFEMIRSKATPLLGHGRHQKLIESIIEEASKLEVMETPPRDVRKILRQIELLRSKAKEQLPIEHRKKIF